MYKCESCEFQVENMIDKTCPKCGADCFEFIEMTDGQSERLERYFADNLDSFVKPYPDEDLDPEEFWGGQLLWENFKEAKKKASDQDVFVYTVVERENDTAWIVDGWYIVNRIGYFFTTKNIEIPEEGIRFW